MSISHCNTIKQINYGLKNYNIIYEIWYVIKDKSTIVCSNLNASKYLSIV